VGYLLLTDNGEWRSLVSIMGADELKRNLGLVSNTITDWELSTQLRDRLRDSLLGLLSEQTSLTHPTTTGLLRDVCERCDLGLSTIMRLAASTLTGQRRRLREFLATRVKRITVKPFMDIHTMLEERLLQCCVHVGTRSQEGADQCAPFCAVQAWAPLSASRLTARAGAARPVPVRMGAT
jgi:hypothetical protein